MEEIRTIILNKDDTKQFGFVPSDIQHIEYEEGEDRIAFTLKVKKEAVKQKKKVKKQKKKAVKKIKKKSVKKAKASKNGVKKGTKRGPYKKRESKPITTKEAKLEEVKEKVVKNVEVKEKLITNLDNSNVEYTYGHVFKKLKENGFRRRRTAEELNISYKDILKVLEHQKKLKPTKVDKELEELDEF